MAKPYSDVMDFAFFAANFHYSRADYDAITPTERAFIYKAWEDKRVSESTVLRDAVFNAVSNAFRKKNQKFRKLWKKRQEKADMEVISQNLSIIEEVEQKEGKSWVSLIYEKNGLKMLERRKKFA